MKKILEENGFGRVQRYDWKDFLLEGQQDHSMAYLPSEDYGDGILVSLNVEAFKAGELEEKVLKIKQKTLGLKNKIKSRLIKWIRNL